MPAAPIIVAAAVGSGAAAALGAAVVGTITAATISTAVATAVGVGVISGVSTAVQGGSSSDILRSAVVGGVSSYVGGQVASKVTSAVASQTGASLVDLEPSLRALSGEGATAAGIASITAGNVAGAATSAAITGKPIEQAALFGAAQSIPFSLEQVGDFSSLDPIVKNVVASSAQAAVMGQDVGEAALAALIQSSAIVSRAINEIPGGQEFIKQKPIYAKYVIDSVSSALAAQLLDKDVSEAVVYSLARTTATVLNNEFTNRAKAAQVEQANQVYQEAEAKTARAREVADRLESINDDPKYARAINIINDNIDFIDNNLAVRYQESLRNYNAAYRMAQIAEEKYRNATPEEQPQFEAEFRYQVDRANNTLRFLQEDQKAFDSAKNQLEGFKNDLTRAGYYNEVASLEDELNTLTADLTELTSNIEGTVNIIAQDASDLFRNFQFDVATTLAPLTGMDATDVTDADIVKEIQPPSQEIGVEVAGPVSPDILGRLQSMPLTGEQVVREQFIDNPDPDIGGLVRKTIQGTRNDGSTYFYTINTFEDGTVVYSAVIDGEAQVFETRPDLKNSTPGIGDVPEGEGAAGTGTSGAPAVDLGQAAPVEVVDPAFTVGFDLRDYGLGSPLSPNLALFEIGGGRGTPGGSSTETTFNLVSRDQGTGQETYDVGGKQYALVVLPDKQVLVPKEPSEVVVYLERDPVTNLPKMKEVPVSIVPPQDAQQIAEKVGQTAGGAPAGAEGAVGGRTAEEERVATTEEQLQPGARPEEVAPGVVAEQPAPSFPELISGITEPTIPAFVPGQAAGTQTGAQPPGSGGIGDEITDEDIIRLIQGEIGTPGGGEGEGAPGEEGAGVGEGEEGVGPGAGEEGAGPGRGGEGTGTGTGEGDGTGEGGGEEITPESPVLPPGVVTLPPPSQQFRFVPQTAPYRVTGQDESGILGRKGPIFGGDEDLQRADWNRRSLRLRRLLGL